MIYVPLKKLFKATQHDVTTATVNGKAVSVEFELRVNKLAALYSLLSPLVHSPPLLMCLIVIQCKHLQQFNPFFIYCSATLDTSL